MSENKHHIISMKVYLIVFVSLLFLTVITVFSAQIDLGSFNIILALLIATIKSSLVLLFFMHLYYDNKTNLLFFLGSVIFLCIFITFTLMDINYRKEIYEIKGASPFDSYQDLNRLEKTGGGDHHDEHDHENRKDSHH